MIEDTNLNNNLNDNLIDKTRSSSSSSSNYSDNDEMILEDDNFVIPPVPCESDEMLEVAELTSQHIDQSDNCELSLEENNDENTDENDNNSENLWIARTGLNYDSLCGAIETIIFMTEKPISLNKIKNFIDDEIPLRIIFESISRLQDEYEANHHGLRLVEVAQGYQFRTKATYSKYVQDIFKVNSLVLTPAVLETLAVISYKQPVSRIELDKIRGVDSSHLIRGLMERRLVKIVGRSEDVGRPVLYGTTPEFLEVFNLNSLEDLPPERELNELSKKDTGKIKDIKKIVSLGDKHQFEFDESEELENLSENIKNIKSETLFTESLKIEERKRKSSVANSDEERVVKSAFDIIEEFIWNKEIIKENEKSVLSECMTSYLDPHVVNDLTAGPFNTPEVDDQGDDQFEMIDLDTGNAVQACESENGLDNGLDNELPDEQNLFMANYKEKEFENLLDKNFESISGEKLPNWEELEGDNSISLKEDEIEQKIEQFSLKAEKLDIDLSLD